MAWGVVWAGVGAFVLLLLLSVMFFVVCAGCFAFCCAVVWCVVLSFWFCYCL